MDNKNLKAINFDAWGGLDNFLIVTGRGGGANARASQLKSVVPWLGKAIQMTSNAAASLPFQIYNASGDVIDDSADWQDTLGGIDNPFQVLYLIASSLCGGRAYLRPTITSKRIVNLQYISPHTITPKLDKNGVQGFTRTTNEGQVEQIPAGGLIYFWLPDADVEIGEPLTYPLSNALISSELLASMSSTMKIYGDRGFVPAYLGNVKGMPSKDEKEKAENYLTRFLRGAYNNVVKLVNSESLDLIRVGAGMEEMKGSYVEIQKRAIEDIGTSFGIPAALFMSDAAYAAEIDSLTRTWYETSVFVSIYKTIEETFTHQLLAPFGASMRFVPEALSIFQEDESKRAGSVTAYTNAINTNPKVAAFVMSFMGVDLDDAQKAELVALVKEPEKEEPEDKQPEPMAEPEDEAVSLSPDETKDIALWYSKAKTWNLKGKGNAVDWENKHLRESIAAGIRLRLASAKTELDIVKAFEIGRQPKVVQDDTAIKALAASIDALAKAG